MNIIVPQMAMAYCTFMGATIAQWIRLHLPSCRPGSSPKHTIYAFFNLYC